MKLNKNKIRFVEADFINILLVNFSALTAAQV